MKFIIITLFPEMFDGVLGSSILSRGREKGLISFEFVNLRDFGIGNRKQVDDTPYGGGAGMVLRVDVMESALEAAKLKVESKMYKVLLMTPQGKRLIQKDVRQMSTFDGDYIIICGHYEGYDERIRSLVENQVSVGDYVLTGGEVPAMILVDAISRLLPGVLGKEASFQDESHEEAGRIEYPHYTRPEVWNDAVVPEVLLSGNHAEIEKWRQSQSDSKSKAN
jgi:tRNA (guanine37-N1)-methyltransferase